MPDTSRYLALERRLHDSTQRRRGASPDGDGWTGTADRLLPASDTPDESPLAKASALPGFGYAFDDGAPIELHVDHTGVPAHDPACGSPPHIAAPGPPAPSHTAPGPTAPGTNSPSPAAPSPTASDATPPGPAAPGPAASGPTAAAGPAAAPDPAPAPAARLASPRVIDAPTTRPAAPSASDLAAIDDDDAFAAQLRELVAHAGTAAAASAPEAAPAPPAFAQPQPAEESRYGIFEQIGESLAASRTFDLGSVPVTAAFEAIERAMDRRTAPTPTRKPEPVPALDEVDIVEDFALMPRTLATPPFVGYTPDHTDVVLIGQAQIPAPSGVPVRNWADLSVTQFPCKSTRAATDVRQIVIHETVSDKWQGVQAAGLGVQFHLDRDGTLVQHNDVLDLLWHIKTFSPSAVGIEVVNLVFDKDVTPGAHEATPVGDRIQIGWGGKQGAYYVVPPQVQMESLAQTVDTLRGQLGIPDVWLQVMPHPDPAKAAGSEKGRTFFLMSTAGHLYLPSATKTSWIASHSVLRDHEDGAFPTLYCWLRLHKAMAPADAYQMARQIVEDPDGRRLQIHYDTKTGATLTLLDITEFA